MGAVARSTARRAIRSGAVWGTVFGLVVASSASGYAASFPTPESRAKLSASFEGNAGLAALLGPARRLDTVAGFTAWRCMAFLTIAGALWGLFLATRLLRGEEDAGRWELFLAGRTTRGRAATEAIIGLGFGLVALWAITAVITVADGRTTKVGFPVAAALYFATSLVAGAAMFLAVGVTVGELAATRRQANGIGAAVLGGSFLIRAAADSDPRLDGLRWASPLGWIEQLHPLTGSRPVAFVPIVGLIAILAGLSVWLAGRRDLYASALPSRDSRSARTAWLRGPGGLTVRLGRNVILGWVAGLAVCGLVFGLVAQSAANAVSGSETVTRIIGRLGGRQFGTTSYLGLAFLVAAALVAFAAAAQVAAARAEEADGHLDNLLARPVSRGRWLAARLAVATALVVLASLVAGLAGWGGAASQHSGVAFTDLLKAGLNLAPPALFVLGSGALIYALWPRWTAVTIYGFVAWSLLVEVVAAGVTTNRWVLDTSVFRHMAPVPAADPNLVSAAWLTGLGVLGAVAAIAAFGRRDLATA